jgi:hypothetical protein
VVSGFTCKTIALTRMTSKPNVLKEWEYVLERIVDLKIWTCCNDTVLG